MKRDSSNLKNVVKRIQKKIRNTLDTISKKKAQEYYSSGKKESSNAYGRKRNIYIIIVLIVTGIALAFAATNFYKEVIVPWRSSSVETTLPVDDTEKKLILDYAPYNVKIDLNGTVYIENERVDRQNRSEFFNKKNIANAISHTDKYVFWNDNRILMYRFNDSREAIIKTYSLPQDIIDIAFFNGGMLISCNDYFYFYDGEITKIGDTGPKLFAAKNDMYVVADDNALTLFDNTFSEINRVEYNFAIEKLFSTESKILGLTKSEDDKHIIIEISSDGTIETAAYLKPGFDPEFMYMCNDILIYPYEKDGASVLALLNTDTFKYEKPISSITPRFVFMSNEKLFLGFNAKTQIIDLNSYKVRDDSACSYIFTPKIYQWAVQK